MAKTIAKFSPWRFYLILSLLILATLGLTARIFILSFFDKEFLLKQGDERTLRLINIPAFRGMIVDRNGFPLAVSTLAYSVWINPQEVILEKEDLASLANLINVKSRKILEIAQQQNKKKREFIYLKRGVSPHVANQIKLLEIPGLYLQQEYRRYYPEGAAAAHVVGFTNIDDKGQEGLELGYNQWLSGEAGKKWVVKDRLGRVIADVEKVQEEKAGKDLTLSIDRRIQFMAYQELMTGVETNKAESGSVIVMDVQTGEILALANLPSYNPNNRSNVPLSAFRNRAITDTFEPGSTIKAFTVAGALESGNFKPDSTIDTSPGWMRVDHNVVKDIRNYGPLSLLQILQFSSNMGVAKLVLGMPADQLWSLLHRMGFGEITGIGFPGEQSGTLVKHTPWGSFTLATLSFGYGLSSTTLQLARAYAVLANRGEKVPLSLLKIEEPPPREHVLDPKIADEMLVLLEAVMSKGGTGHSIHVPGYRVAGKTGTSRKVGKGGYDKHHHNSSFVGIAPLTHPKLVVAVILNDPQGKAYYGAQVAGPVFAKVMEKSLRILNISPDEEEDIQAKTSV